MKEIVIEVENRTPGRGENRRLRVQEMIPAVIYGPKFGNASIKTSWRGIYKHLGGASENMIFTLKSEDSKLNKVKVMVKTKDVNPVTRKPVHLDFYAIDVTQKIRVNIEIRLTGKPLGVADGGLLQAILRSVEVECLPDSIPAFIEVDTSNLGVHDSLHVSDLQVPQGVKVISDGSLTLCTVTIIKEEAVVEVAAAATPVEPEVMAKGKAKEEGAEGAAEGAAAKPGAPAASGDKAKAKA